MALTSAASTREMLAAMLELKFLAVFRAIAATMAQPDRCMHWSCSNPDFRLLGAGVSSRL